MRLKRSVVLVYFAVAGWLCAESVVVIHGMRGDMTLYLEVRPNRPGIKMGGLTTQIRAVNTNTYI